MIDLTGKSAIVTGATRGIGRAIATTLGAAGASVVCNGRNEALLNAVVAEICGAGGRAEAVAGDADTAETGKELVARAIESFGQLDVVVCNAGITRDNLFVRMKQDEWDDVIRTNLTGPYLLLRAAARPLMRQRSGSIINISSVTAQIGNAGQANYTAAKGGLNSLTRSLARELGPRNIRVNCVAPGLIRTEMLDKVPDEMLDKLKSQVPLSRLGDPNDVAAMVAFLASDLANFITGQIFAVDGGLAMG